MSKSKWISASDTGRAAYCGHHLELKERGCTVSSAAIKARAKGNIAHDQLNQQAEDKRCFVASYLYGIDAPDTQALRNYRDNALLPHFYGRLFIKIYYKLSPFLIRSAKTSSTIKHLLKLICDSSVKKARLSNDTQ